MLRHLALAAAIALASCGGGSSDARPIVNSTKGAGGGGCGANKSLALAWALPVTNADNTTIGTITGQNVYYDTVSRAGTGVDYASSVSVGDGTSTTYTLTCLAASTTYYVATTIIVGGVESSKGAEVSATTAP